MEDLYPEDSIDLLRSSGLDFKKHSFQGIETSDFAEMLISSGLVLMDNVTWITFHSAYDFGYLLAQLTAQKLPDSETEFLASLKIFFPNFYDIKYLILSTDNLRRPPVSGQQDEGEEDWIPASGGLRLPTHGPGLLQDL